MSCGPRLHDLPAVVMIGQSLPNDLFDVDAEVVEKLFTY
jgi:hypothetical protein